MFEDLRKEIENCEILTDKNAIKARLKELLFEAVETPGKIGIAFSGGLDSSLMALIADKLGMDFTLYSVGLEESDDLKHARKLAAEMGWELKVKVVKLEDAEKIFREVIRITERSDIVTVGVGAVVYCVLEMAKEDGVKIVLGGLGSEEIFAGYQRHVDYGKKDYSRVNERLWDGLKDLEKRDLVRDEPLAKHFGIELKAPFLNEDLVKYAMQIDPKLKINDDHKKIILCEVAENLGLPKEFAWRKKKAAQYGSRLDRAILRLAHRKKFKFKKPYLQSLQ